MSEALARQLDELEDLVRRQPDRALGLAHQVQGAAEDLGDLALARRALLVQYHVLLRRGRTSDCVQAFRDVNSWSVLHGHTYLQARSHRLLSELFRWLGDHVLALEHAVAGVELLDPLIRSALRADHVLALADALAACKSFDDARARYLEAGRYADLANDVHLRMIVLDHMTNAECMAGRAEQAVASAERLLNASEAHGIELMPAARETVARALILVGRYDAAERTLQPALTFRRGDPGRDVGEVAQALLAMAEIHRHQQRPVAAQIVLERCLAWCDEHQLNGLGVRAQREQAELYAAQGKFKEAYETFRSYHDAENDLSSVEREARARTRQAIYEVTEARRDSARFRELAIRDSLTGLHNRRFIDEKLPAMLLHAADAGMRMTVALLDIDHFKRVNDDFSHDVGDDVLRIVAQILEGAGRTVRASMSARMGGEEFLLVLPGLVDGDALVHLERLRVAMASYPWDEVAPGLRVTTSIGAVTAPDDGVDMSTVLRHADTNLYAAKDAGRNRVVHGLRYLAPG